jgi:hypothetical protein
MPERQVRCSGLCRARYGIPPGGRMKDRFWHAVSKALRPLVSETDVVLAPRGDWPPFPRACAFYDEILDIADANPRAAQRQAHRHRKGRSAPDCARMAMLRMWSPLVRYNFLSWTSEWFSQPYFGGPGDTLETALCPPVAGLHVDLVRAPNQLDLLRIGHRRRTRDGFCRPQWQTRGNGFDRTLAQW